MSDILSLKKAAASVISAAVCFSLLAGCGQPEQPAGASQTDAAQPSSDTTAETAQEPAAQLGGGWTYGQIAVGGGGFVTGVFSTCEKGVYYARTDVGGAYRWDDSAKQWKSLNYWVSQEDVGLLGISALAVDPSNAARVWLLAGTSYFSNGKTCILRSDDYGESFEVIDVSDQIRVHGNCMGRGNGERLAVDPNNTDILFAGGNTGGIIKSTDGGNTWTFLDSFPVKGTGNDNGVNIIVFDPSSASGGASQRIYAAASQTKDNLFVSEDGGESWKALDAGIEGSMPQRIKLDSKNNLYIVCADKEGPWNQSKGAVYKYDVSAGTSENIAPGATPFGDIAIDPSNDDRMVLVTTQTWLQQPNGAYGDKFYTTNDGGKTWNDTLSGMKMSTNDTPWIEGYAIHWCCSLAIDNFDSGRIMVTSGNGIFACDNVWDSEPLFYFNSRGIEETVPMDLITLEDYPLVSAIMDYDGHVHKDIYTPADPHGGSIGGVTSITIAPQNRDYWAKVGGSSDGMKFMYSTDGGKTWNSIKHPPEKGKMAYCGKIAFNADGSRLIWNPEGSFMTYYTEDLGNTWTQCDGLMGRGLYLIGDAVDPDHVYAYAGEKLYVSSDGGKSFKNMYPTFFTSEDRLCVSPSEAGTFWLPAGAGLYKTTDFGESFTKYDTVKMCRCVSIGKAKNDGDPYVIYIYGTIADNDREGIYMSEDEGATWTPVTDEAHQFGGMGNGDWICADLNVYGRCYMSTVGLGICYCDKIEK